jgi:RNA polymerase sigma factor (sigma-70 family)
LTPKASEARYWNPSYDNASQHETLSKIYFVDCHFATDKDIIEQESLDYIWNAIDRLDDDGRRIVEMLIEDTPNAEIAKALGYSDGNLRVRIYRIRKTLKSYGLCG